MYRQSNPLVQNLATRHYHTKNVLYYNLVLLQMIVIVIIILNLSLWVKLILSMILVFW